MSIASRRRHKFHLLAIPEPRFFQIRPKHAVDQPHRRKVLDPREAKLAQLPQKRLPQQERIGPAHPRQHRRLLHHPQNLGRHLQHNLIRAPVWHHPRHRPMPRHSEPARVINHDQVNPARFLALRRQTRARPTTKNRLPTPRLARSRFHDFGSPPHALRSLSLDQTRSTNHRPPFKQTHFHTQDAGIPSKSPRALRHDDVWDLQELSSQHHRSTDSDSSARPSSNARRSRRARRSTISPHWSRNSF